MRDTPGLAYKDEGFTWLATRIADTHGITTRIIFTPGMSRSIRDTPGLAKINDRYTWYG